MADTAVHGVWNQYSYYFNCPYRSSFPEVYCKKRVLKKFAKFTGKG